MTKNSKDVTQAALFAELHGQQAVLTVGEAAQELRCSRAHLQNAINGKVHDLPPLPVIRIGRRKMIRRESLQRWLDGLEATQSIKS